MSGRTTVNIQKYDVDDNVNLDDDLFNISFGATLVLLGNDVLTDDAIEGAGRVSVRGSTTIDDGLSLGGSALFVDMDAVTQNGGTLALGQTADDSVTARNIAGATWTFASGAGITGQGASQFVNLGALVFTGDDNTVDANFYDRGGSIQANGTLDFDSPGYVNRFIDDQINVGVVTNTSPVTYSGVFELNGGVLVGSTVFAGTVDLIDARIVGDVSIASQTFDASYLNLGAGSVLDVEGVMIARGDIAGSATFGEIIGPGEVDVGATGNAFEINASNLRIVGAVTFDNRGSDGFGLQGFGDDTSISTDAWSGQQITIENLGVGSDGSYGVAVWNDEGNSGRFAARGAGTTVFYNGPDGFFFDSTTEGTVFDMRVVNDGTMGAQAGATSGGMTFDQSVSGSGSIKVGSEQVTIGAAVDAGQTLAFQPAENGAAAPTLTINDVQDFAGLISGFGQGEVMKVETSVWQYQDFAPGSDGTGGSLMFSNGSATAALNLTGSFAADDFHATVTGAQTTITYG